MTPFQIFLAVVALLVLSMVLVMQGEPKVDAIKGEVFYRERIALPPSAVVEVKLLDVSKADAAAETIAVAKPKPRRPPIPFEIVYDGNDIDPKRRYAVRATITEGDRLLFTSTDAYLVLDGKPSGDLKIRVAMVGSDKSAEDARVAQAEALMVKIFQVDSVSLDASNPDEIRVCANGTARSGGYGGVRLEPAGTGGGVLTFDLVADPPSGPAMQALTPVSAKISSPAPSGVTSVRVRGETNEVTVEIGKSQGECVVNTGSSSPGDASQTLVGEWLAEDIKGAGVIDDAQSTVAFDAESNVSGSGGCNRIRGSATVSGETLALSPLASTRKMCPPALMDQENKFLAALAETKTFRFDGAFLKFYAADGSELLRFTKKA